MAIVIVALAYFSSISARKEVCKTQNCQDYANQLRRDMNRKVDPCDNFYKYVCGNWNKNHPVPTDRAWQSQNFLVFDTIQNRLLEILQSDVIDGENSFVKKAKELHKGCMDNSTIKKNGIGEIMNYVEETGGWPIIMSPSEWRKIKKPWQTVDSEYNVIMGISPFVHFTVQPALKKFHINYLRVRPSFSPGDSSSNMSDLFSDPAVKEEMNLIKNIAGVMAGKRRFKLDERQVERDAQGIVSFLHYLKYIAESPGSNSVHFPTIKEFQKFSDSFSSIPPERRINWLQRISKLFVRESSVRINSSTTIVVHHENYFKGLFSILSTIPERHIVNTIQWWFVKQTLTYTNPEMLRIRDSRPRWMKCIRDNELQYLLAYVQVEKDVVEKTKARIVNMAKEVKIAMKKEIARSKWPLDDYSKSAAKKKVDSMRTLVGYPDWYKDPTVLGNELYQNLLSGSSYLENVLRAKQFGLQQKLELLGKPFDEWSIIPSIINANAHQSNEVNSIAFPAGILQKPLFNADYPDAIHYGGIGTSIGHEMSHAFDSEGIHYDEHGKKGVWWSNNATLEHEKRCQCFIKQFNKYGGLGDRTLKENIADSTGVRATFVAYKAHTRRSHNRNKKLPGLESLSSDKLFFVSFAWAHCMNVKPEFVTTLRNRSKHSPSHDRVNGALSNSEDFSKAFKCKINSPMNPSVKCTIW